MKTLITLLLSIVTIAVSAQNVTITFQGANRNRNYQVIVDDVSYYSANNVSTNGRSVVSIPNLEAGSHNLKVYRLNSNAGVYTDGTTTNTINGTEVYSKTFQLRQGYDMNIVVRNNGAVSFTEKRSQNQSTAVGTTPMSSTAVNQLLINVRNKRYQSDKIAAINTAFNTTGNYFTTSQVRQLLLLVNSESRRLELAKLSYAKVTDPTNFSYVYDVLNSENSRDQLDDYVVSQKGYSSTSTQNNTAYGTAMSEVNFNQLLTRTKNYLYQDDRIAEIRNTLNNTNNFFSTAQIRQLLLLVTAEADRLSLAKLSFPRVVDRNSFNQLIDLFYNQYNRDELNNFIISNGGVANTTTYTPPMSDASFTQIYNKARSHFFQRNTVKDIKDAFNNTANKFSTEQVRQLLLLATAEPDRLALAKLAFPRVVDRTNFSQLTDLFTIQSNRSELEIFIQAQQK
jgi:hypothetical protein